MFEFTYPAFVNSTEPNPLHRMGYDFAFPIKRSSARESQQAVW